MIVTMTAIKIGTAIEMYNKNDQGAYFNITTSACRIALHVKLNAKLLKVLHSFCTRSTCLVSRDTICTLDFVKGKKHLC